MRRGFVPVIEILPCDAAEFAEVVFIILKLTSAVDEEVALISTIVPVQEKGMYEKFTIPIQVFRGGGGIDCWRRFPWGTV